MRCSSGDAPFAGIITPQTRVPATYACTTGTHSCQKCHGTVVRMLTVVIMVVLVPVVAVVVVVVVRTFSIAAANSAAFRAANDAAASCAVDAILAHPAACDASMARGG